MDERDAAGGGAGLLWVERAADAVGGVRGSHPRHSVSSEVEAKPVFLHGVRLASLLQCLVNEGITCDHQPSQNCDVFTRVFNLSGTVHGPPHVRKS